ncbi:MAG: hypothetical protein U0746_21050 [Gemmataceae bacterium]
MNPSDCTIIHDVLQTCLDGDPYPLPDAIRAHVDHCRVCRERLRAAELVLACPAPTVTVSPLLTAQIVAAVRRDTMRRRRMRWLAWSGAAGVAVAAGIAVMVTVRPADESAVVRVEPAPASVIEPLHLDQVGEAVVAFSKRTAASAADQGRLLLPEVPIPATLPALEGTSRPLAEARTGLAQGFEPVATSARRALNLVWRDLGTATP